MANLKLLIFSLFFAFSGVSFAGYAQVAPPVNWTESAGKFFYKAAANDVFIAKNTVLTNASLNVGGRSVVMPAAMRFAANAPLVASRAAFLNPALFIGITAGSVLYEYYKSKEVTAEQDGWYQKTKKVDFTWYHQWGGIGWSDPLSAYKAVWGPNPYPNTSWSVSEYTHTTDNNFTAIVTATNASGPGSISAVAGGVQVVSGGQPKKLNETQYDDLFRDLPIPEGMPQRLPVPLPVEIPVINPFPVPSPQRKVNPSPNDPPLPITSPNSKPLRLPQGEPQLVPDSNPKRWEQPSIDIVPSPTPDSPWRVDVQPKKIETSDGKPLPPVSTPNTNKPYLPDGTPNPDYDPAAEPNPNEKPTPEEQKDLCEKNPDILACSKPEFDTPDEADLQTVDKEVSISPESGWGSGGSCPAPRHLPGANLDIPFTQYCDFMSGIKPIVLALAWLSAAMILIGARQSSSS